MWHLTVELGDGCIVWRSAKMTTRIRALVLWYGLGAGTWIEGGTINLYRSGKLVEHKRCPRKRGHSMVHEDEDG